MLSAADKKWLANISDNEKIEIIPYDPNAEALFSKQKEQLKDILGPNIKVLHVGASGMGISGQDEIDIAIPIMAKHFDTLVDKLQKKYGKPDSFQPGIRARYNMYHSGKKMEVALINQQSPQWQRTITFERYLKTHPELLKAYKELKEMNNGRSKREYYHQKIEFINDILDKADQ
jgi:GrpB-like predicted nucleotidyltransferase (UPF0157 family)